MAQGAVNGVDNYRLPLDASFIHKQARLPYEWPSSLIYCRPTDFHKFPARLLPFIECCPCTIILHANLTLIYGIH